MNPLSEAQKFIQQFRPLSTIQRRKLLRGMSKPFPRFLYKYIPFDETNQESLSHTADLITHSKLWLSSPSDFNDPFDMSSYMDYTGTPTEKRERLKRMFKSAMPELKRKEIESRISDMMLDQDKLIETARSVRQKEIDRCGVCCFSKDPKNLLMWSHYANKHQGLVAQFELTKDLENLFPTLTVDYSDHYPKYRWVEDDDPSKMRGLLLKKFSDWEYEQERRLIVIGKARTSIRLLPSALTGIIFGCRTSDTAKQHIQTMLSNKPSNVRLFQAIKHEMDYKLMIQRI